VLILFVSFLIAVADQATKESVKRFLPSGTHIPVLPGFFNLSHVQNTGAAWGVFAGFNGWLIVVSVIMLAAIVVLCRNFLTRSMLLPRIAVGFMIGGIVGNLADRLRLGHVVDFLDFYLGSCHFPAFNVADSSICVGVGLYMLSQILAERRRSDPALPASEQPHAE